MSENEVVNAKAQETADAELLALAALVTYEAAVINGQVTQYGQFMCDPRSEAAEQLTRLLTERDILR